ncbi:histidine phosphatase family protein [Polycladidibacter hongkongensis]|uniref:histidine phosphatase family protein n=1 Tax=Polycladidibacter hongkongensis TaxID=1647556 RepID=UPI0008314FCA|nr:histidine phosphatase family protein [Pseudovibrio hongkongensis]
MTRIVVARHGNTFDKGDVVTRVGGRTDLPLSVSGKAQAAALAEHCQRQGLRFNRAFCSPLQRTKQTARAVLELQGDDVELKVLPFLVEVDYGPDENKPEAEVVARIGEAALKAWEEQAVPPPGWHIDPPAVIGRWQEFFAKAVKSYAGEDVLLVTSNGIARFALQAAGLAEGVDLKLKTGAYGVFELQSGGEISLTSWNLRP